MILKKLYQLQEGDYLKTKKTNEYFLIIGVHRYNISVDQYTTYIELEWADFKGYGRVYIKALKKIFQFDPESKNYILTFKKENDHYE